MSARTAVGRMLPPLVVVMIFIATLLAVVGSIGAIYLLDGCSKTETVADKLCSGWDLSFNDKQYASVDLEQFIFQAVKRGDTVVISRTLPEKLPDDPLMVVYEHYYDLVVTLDGEEILRAETELYDKGKVLGSGFRTVKLGSGAAGKTVRIRMRVGENNAFKKLAAPELWNGDSFFRDYASTKIFPMALGFFLIIFGCSMSILAFAGVVRKIFSPVDMFRLTGIGLFSLSFGVWMMGELNITELFSINLAVKAHIKYCSFYILPCAFLSYQIEDDHGSLNTRKNQFWKIMWFIYLIFFVVTNLLYYVCNLNMRASLKYMHAFSVCMVVMVLIFRIDDIRKKKSRFRMSLYATIAVGLAMLTGLIRYNVTVSGSGFTSNLLYFTIVTFVLALLYDYVIDAMQSVRAVERATIMEKLAFTDELTGLNNRQATERFFDKIDMSKEPYIIVQFDLNHLKKINDGYGHEAGDSYIVIFADAMKKLLDGKGFMARTGGDEFVYVLRSEKESDKVWLLDTLKNLNATLAQIDTGYEGLPLSTAYGIYESNGVDGLEIRAGLRVADESMYSMKKAMHAARGE